MATYKNTETGQISLTVNRHQATLRRRNGKIETKNLQIKELEDEEKISGLSKAKQIKLKRYRFELNQALADREELLLEVETLQELKKGHDPKINQKDQKEENNPSAQTTSIQTDDQFIQSLGLNPEIVDSREVEFQNL